MSEIIDKTDRRVSDYFRRLERMTQQIELLAEQSTPYLNGERYMTDKEVSEWLRVSRRTLQEGRDKGVVGYTMLGGKALYKESDLQQLLDKNYFKAFEGV